MLSINTLTDKIASDFITSNIYYPGRSRKINPIMLKNIYRIKTDNFDKYTANFIASPIHLKIKIGSTIYIK